MRHPSGHRHHVGRLPEIKQCITSTKPPTGNFQWAVSFYGRLKAEAGTHSVRVITSANQIVIADMGVEELLHRHIAVNPDLRAAKIILVQIFDV